MPGRRGPGRFQRRAPFEEPSGGVGLWCNVAGDGLISEQSGESAPRGGADLSSTMVTFDFHQP